MSNQVDLSRPNAPIFGQKDLSRPNAVTSYPWQDYPTYIPYTRTSIDPATLKSVEQVDYVDQKAAIEANDFRSLHDNAMWAWDDPNSAQALQKKKELENWQNLWTKTTSGADPVMSSSFQHAYRKMYNKGLKSFGEASKLAESDKEFQSQVDALDTKTQTHLINLLNSRYNIDLEKQKALASKRNSLGYNHPQVVGNGITPNNNSIAPTPSTSTQGGAPTNVTTLTPNASGAPTPAGTPTQQHNNNQLAVATQPANTNRTVNKVYDGDTYGTVDNRTHQEKKLRLAQGDTFETSLNPRLEGQAEAAGIDPIDALYYGREAKAMMKSKFKDKPVLVTLGDKKGRSNDTFGRELGNLQSEDGEDAYTTLSKNGLLVDSKHRGGTVEELAAIAGRNDMIANARVGQNAAYGGINLPESDQKYNREMNMLNQRLLAQGSVTAYKSKEGNNVLGLDMNKIYEEYKLYKYEHAKLKSQRDTETGGLVGTMFGIADYLGVNDRQKLELDKSLNKKNYAQNLGGFAEAVWDDVTQVTHTIANIAFTDVAPVFARVMTADWLSEETVDDSRIQAYDNYATQLEQFLALSPKWTKGSDQPFDAVDPLNPGSPTGVIELNLDGLNNQKGIGATNYIQVREPGGEWRNPFYDKNGTIRNLWDVVPAVSSMINSTVFDFNPLADRANTNLSSYFTEGITSLITGVQGIYDTSIPTPTLNTGNLKQTIATLSGGIQQQDNMTKSLEEYTQLNAAEEWGWIASLAGSTMTGSFKAASKGAPLILNGMKATPKAFAVGGQKVMALAKNKNLTKFVNAVEKAETIAKKVVASKFIDKPLTMAGNVVSSVASSKVARKLVRSADDVSGMTKTQKLVQWMAETAKTTPETALTFAIAHYIDQHGEVTDQEIMNSMRNGAIFHAVGKAGDEVIGKLVQKVYQGKFARMSEHPMFSRQTQAILYADNGLMSLAAMKWNPAAQMISGPFQELATMALEDNGYEQIKQYVKDPNRWAQSAVQGLIMKYLPGSANKDANGNIRDMKGDWKKGIEQLKWIDAQLKQFDASEGDIYNVEITASEKSDLPVVKSAPVVEDKIVKPVDDIISVEAIEDQETVQEVVAGLNAEEQFDKAVEGEVVVPMGSYGSGVKITRQGAEPVETPAPSQEVVVETVNPAQKEVKEAPKKEPTLNKDGTPRAPYGSKTVAKKAQEAAKKAVAEAQPSAFASESAVPETANEEVLRQEQETKQEVSNKIVNAKFQREKRVNGVVPETQKETPPTSTYETPVPPEKDAERQKVKRNVGTLKNTIANVKQLQAQKQKKIAVRQDELVKATYGPKAYIGAIDATNYAVFDNDGKKIDDSKPILRETRKQAEKEINPVDARVIDEAKAKAATEINAALRLEKFDGQSLTYDDLVGLVGNNGNIDKSKLSELSEKLKLKPYVPETEADTKKEVFNASETIKTDADLLMERLADPALDSEAASKARAEKESKEKKAKNLEKDLKKRNTDKVIYEEKNKNAVEKAPGTTQNDPVIWRSTDGRHVMTKSDLDITNMLLAKADLHSKGVDLNRVIFYSMPPVSKSTLNGFYLDEAGMIYLNTHYNSENILATSIHELTHPGISVKIKSMSDSELGEFISEAKVVFPAIEEHARDVYSRQGLKDAELERKIAEEIVATSVGHKIGADKSTSYKDKVYPMETYVEGSALRRATSYLIEKVMRKKTEKIPTPESSRFAEVRNELQAIERDGEWDSEVALGLKRAIMQLSDPTQDIFDLGVGFLKNSSVPEVLAIGAEQMKQAELDPANMVKVGNQYLNKKGKEFLDSYASAGRQAWNALKDISFNLEIDNSVDDDAKAAGGQHEISQIHSHALGEMAAWLGMPKDNMIDRIQTGDWNNPDTFYQAVSKAVGMFNAKHTDHQIDMDKQRKAATQLYLAALQQTKTKGVEFRMITHADGKTQLTTIKHEGACKVGDNTPMAKHVNGFMQKPSNFTNFQNFASRLGAKIGFESAGGAFTDQIGNAEYREMLHTHAVSHIYTATGEVDAIEEIVRGGVKTHGLVYDKAGRAATDKLMRVKINGKTGELTYHKVSYADVIAAKVTGYWGSRSKELFNIGDVRVSEYMNHGFTADLWGNDNFVDNLLATMETEDTLYIPNVSGSNSAGVLQINQTALLLDKTGAPDNATIKELWGTSDGLDAIEDSLAEVEFDYLKQWFQVPSRLQPADFTILAAEQKPVEGQTLADINLFSHMTMDILDGKATVSYKDSLGEYINNPKAMELIKQVEKRLNGNKNASNALDRQGLLDYIHPVKAFKGKHNQDKAGRESAEGMSERKQFLKQKMLAMIDFVQLAALDNSMDFLEPFSMAEDGTVKWGKKIEKYAKALVRQNNLPDKENIEKIFGYDDYFTKDGKFNAPGLHVMTDADGEQQYGYKAYIFDPAELRTEFDENHPLLRYFDENKLDGGTLIIDPRAMETVNRFNNNNPYSAIKSEARILTDGGSLHVKHAEHLVLFDEWDNRIDPALVAYINALKAQGITAIVPTSATKMNGTAQYTIKNVNNKDLAFSPKGELFGEYKDGRVSPVDGPNGKPIKRLNFDPMGVPNMDISAGLIDLPVTGNHGFKYMPSKGEIHGTASSLPYRALPFYHAAENNPFMDLAARNVLENYQAKLAGDVEQALSVLNDLGSFMDNASSTGTIYGTLTGKQEAAIYRTLDRLRKSIEESLDQDNPLSLMPQDITLKAVEQIKEVLKVSKTGVKSLDKPKLLKFLMMDDIIFSNSKDKQLMPRDDFHSGVGTVYFDYIKKTGNKALMLHAPGKNMVYSPVVNPIGGFWRLVDHVINKEGHTIDENMSPEVTQSLYNKLSVGDYGSLDVLDEKLLKFLVDKDLIKLTSKSDEAGVTNGYEINGIDMEKNAYTSTSEGMMVSADFFEKHPGDTLGRDVISYITPSDNVSSMLNFKIMGIYPAEISNRVSYAPEISMKLQGKDMDIDVISVATHGKYLSKDDFDTLVSGLRNSRGEILKSKQLTVDIRNQKLNKRDFIDVDSGFGKRIAVPRAWYMDNAKMDEFLASKGVPPENFSKYHMAYKESIFGGEVQDNHDTLFGYSPMHPLSYIQSRKHTSNKTIGIAASVGNKLAAFYSSNPNGMKFTVPVLEPGRTKDSSITQASKDKNSRIAHDRINGVSVKNVNVIINYDPERIGYHLAQGKEPAVDIYNYFGFDPDPIEMAAHCLVEGYADKPIDERTVIKDYVEALLQKTSNPVEAFKGSKRNSNFDTYAAFTYSGKSNDKMPNAKIMAKQIERLVKAGKATVQAYDGLSHKWLPPSKDVTKLKHALRADVFGFNDINKIVNMKSADPLSSNKSLLEVMEANIPSVRSEGSLDGLSAARGKITQQLSDIAWDYKESIFGANEIDLDFVSPFTLDAIRYEPKEYSQFSSNLNTFQSGLIDVLFGSHNSFKALSKLAVPVTLDRTATDAQGNPIKDNDVRGGLKVGLVPSRMDNVMIRSIFKSTMQPRHASIKGLDNGNYTHDNPMIVTLANEHRLTQASIMRDNRTAQSVKLPYSGSTNFPGNLNIGNTPNTIRKSKPLRVGIWTETDADGVRDIKMALYDGNGEKEVYADPNTGKMTHIAPISVFDYVEKGIHSSEVEGMDQFRAILQGALDAGDTATSLYTLDDIDGYILNGLAYKAEQAPSPYHRNTDIWVNTPLLMRKPTDKELPGFIGNAIAHYAKDIGDRVELERLGLAEPLYNDSEDIELNLDRMLSQIGQDLTSDQIANLVAGELLMTNFNSDIYVGHAISSKFTADMKLNNTGQDRMTVDKLDKQQEDFVKKLRDDRRTHAPRTDGKTHMEAMKEAIQQMHSEYKATGTSFKIPNMALPVALSEYGLTAIQSAKAAGLHPVCTVKQIPIEKMLDNIYSDLVRDIAEPMAETLAKGIVNPSESLNVDVNTDPFLTNRPKVKKLKHVLGHLIPLFNGTYTKGQRKLEDMLTKQGMSLSDLADGKASDIVRDYLLDTYQQATGMTPYNKEQLRKATEDFMKTGKSTQEQRNQILASQLIASMSGRLYDSYQNDLHNPHRNKDHALTLDYLISLHETARELARPRKELTRFSLFMKRTMPWADDSLLSVAELDSQLSLKPPAAKIGNAIEFVYDDGNLIPIDTGMDYGSIDALLGKKLDQWGKYSPRLVSLSAQHVGAAMAFDQYSKATINLPKQFLSKAFDSNYMQSLKKRTDIDGEYRHAQIIRGSADVSKNLWELLDGDVFEVLLENGGGQINYVVKYGMAEGGEIVHRMSNEATHDQSLDIIAQSITTRANDKLNDMFPGMNAADRREAIKLALHSKAVFAGPANVAARKMLATMELMKESMISRKMTSEANFFDQQLIGVRQFINDTTLNLASPLYDRALNFNPVKRVTPELAQAATHKFLESISDVTHKSMLSDDHLIALRKLASIHGMRLTDGQLVATIAKLKELNMAPVDDLLPITNVASHMTSLKGQEMFVDMLPKQFENLDGAMNHETGQQVLDNLFGNFTRLYSYGAESLYRAESNDQELLGFPPNELVRREMAGLFADMRNDNYIYTDRIPAIEFGTRQFEVGQPLNIATADHVMGGHYLRSTKDSIVLWNNDKTTAVAIDSIKNMYAGKSRGWAGRKIHQDLVSIFKKGEFADKAVIGTVAKLEADPGWRSKMANAYLAVPSMIVGLQHMRIGKIAKLLVTTPVGIGLLAVGNPLALPTLAYAGKQAKDIISAIPRLAMGNISSGYKQHISATGFKSITDVMSVWRNSQSIKHTLGMSHLDDSIEAENVTLGGHSMPLPKFLEARKRLKSLKNANSILKSVKAFERGDITKSEMHKAVGLAHTMLNRTDITADNVLEHMERYFLTTPDGAEFIDRYGRSAASLISMKHAFLKESIASIGGIMRMVGTSENKSRRLSEAAASMQRDRLYTDRDKNPNIMAMERAIVTQMANIATGQYGKLTRTLDDKNPLARTAKLYGRFHKSNHLWFTNRIFANMDKETMARQLMQDVPGLVNLHTHNESMPEYTKQFVRQAAFGGAQGIVMGLANAGIGALIAAMNVGWFEEFYKFIASDIAENAVQTGGLQNTYTGFASSLVHNGVYALTVMAAETDNLIDAIRVGEMPVSQMKKLVADAANSGFDLFTYTGQGRSVSAAAGALLAAGTNIGMYLAYDQDSNNPMYKTFMDETHRYAIADFVKSVGNATPFMNVGLDLVYDPLMNITQLKDPLTTVTGDKKSSKRIGGSKGDSKPIAERDWISDKLKESKVTPYNGVEGYKLKVKKKKKGGKPRIGEK